MKTCKCPICGFPRISLVWDAEAKRWTGRCKECLTIVYPEKTEVVFL